MNQAATPGLVTKSTPGMIQQPAQELTPTGTQALSPLTTTRATFTPAQGSNKGSTQIPKCVVSSNTAQAYSATMCFTSPETGSTLTGDTTISVALTASGTNAGVERIIFYLNDTYLLTDFQSPYSFILPTAAWVDGAYVLSAEAMMRDGSVTDRVSLSLQFKNGEATLPKNESTFHPATGTLPDKGKPFIVAATGDGASGEASAQKVSDMIASLNPNLFLYLGDVYESGSMAEFYNWYGTAGTNFSRFRPITDPTVGNHEYLTKEAQAYFDYWNNIPSYYSFNAGGWHFISLNANANHVPTDIQSSQYQWLEKDLADNANACTIVFYHQPLFNIGPEGSDSSMSDIWTLMAQYGVSIVLNGHDHDYQRWVALDGNGQPDPNGITEFVAGGGGHGIQKLSQTDKRVAYSNDLNPDTFGALELKLNSGGVEFSYINNQGANLDSGVIRCSKASADVQPPSSPNELAAKDAGATKVDLSWQTSTDDTGVNGYTIYRDGTALGTVSGTTLTYSDNTAMPSTTYSYKVDAFDLAGNHSAASGTVSVTTSAMPSSLTFSPDADTYVNATSPDSNYGGAMTFRLDSTPDVRAYVRFIVKGLAGMSIAHARMMIYSNQGSSLGFQIQSVADNSWGERTTNYGNAPALGGVLAASGPISAGSWVTIDLSAYITGEGMYTFGISTTSKSALSFPTRESGQDAPQLVIDLTQ